MIDDLDELLVPRNKALVVFPSDLRFRDPQARILQVECRLQEARFEDTMSEIRIWTALTHGLLIGTSGVRDEFEISSENRVSVAAAILRKARVALPIHKKGLEAACKSLIKLGSTKAQHYLQSYIVLKVR